MDSGGELQILSRALAVLAADQIVLDPITLVQIIEPGPLDGRDVHESVGPAALRLDKTKSLGGIEPLPVFKNLTSSLGARRAICRRARQPQRMSEEAASDAG
jgi:hypothetical protein